MMIRKDMENKYTELNDEQLDAVQGAGGILELVGDGIGYLFDRMTEKIDELAGPRRDGCTGEQVVPGFNVY